MQLVIALFVLLFTTILAEAESTKIIGSSSPNFLKAKQDWLNGEDLSALKQLSLLAHNGNLAAQILLAQIASRGLFHSHVTRDLTRNERIELLRFPKGLSGQTWLINASQKNKLAMALLLVNDENHASTFVVDLVNWGEKHSALIGANKVFSNGQGDKLIQHFADRSVIVPENIRVLNDWYSQSSNIGMQSRKVTPITYLHKKVAWGDFEFSTWELEWVAPAPEILLNQLGTRETTILASPKIESWKPMYQFCKQNCTESVKACTTVGMSVLSGLGPNPIRSPLESVISNEQYLASRRVTADLVRSLPNLRRSPDYLDEIDSCLFDKILPLQRQFGYRK